MEDVKKFAAHFRTHQTILNADVTFTFYCEHYPRMCWRLFQTTFEWESGAECKLKFFHLNWLLCIAVFCQNHDFYMGQPGLFFDFFNSFA